MFKKVKIFFSSFRLGEVLIMKAAVIGLGRIGFRNGVDYFSHSSGELESHVGAIHRSDFLELSAVCDSKKNLLGDFHQIDSSIEVFNQPKEMFKKTKIELLTIATRTRGRISLMQDAINFGIRNFHVEKPLCQSRTELLLITKILSIEGNILFTYGATRRFLEIFQFAKSLCLSKEFGLVKKVLVNMGEKTLFWSHPHSVDLLLFFLEDYSSPFISYIGEELQFIEDSKSIFVRNDPIVKQLEFDFPSGKKGIITNIESNEIEIELDFAKIVIQQNYNKVVVREISNSDFNTYSFSSEAEGMSGIRSALSQHYLSEEHGDPFIKLRRAMLDAIRGQEMMFEICENVLASQGIQLSKQEKLKLVYLAESAEGIEA